MDDWELIKECRIWFEEAKNLGPSVQNGFMLDEHELGVTFIPVETIGRGNFREFTTYYISLNVSQELPWLIGLS